MKIRLNKATLTLLIIAIIATGVMGISSRHVRNEGVIQHESYVNQNYVNENRRFEEQLLTSLFSQTMIGYYELKKAQDPDVEPYDVFIKGKDDKALRESLSQYYDTTIFNPNIAGVYAQYLIHDNVSKKMISNDTTQTLTTLLNNPATNSTLPWYIMFSFDDKGVMSITSFKFLSDEFTQDLRDTHQQLIDLYDETLVSSGGYTMRSELGESSKSLVRDATFIFALDQSTVDERDNTITSDTYYYYDTYTDIATPICVTIILMLILAIFLSNINAEEVLFYKLARKIPYEVYLFLCLCLLPILFGSYSILYSLASSFLSINTLWACIQLGMCYLLIAYVSLMIKDSYFKKTWKENFILRNILSYITTIDLTKKDGFRTLFLVFINFVIIITFIAMGSAGVFFAILYSILIYMIVLHYLNKTQKDYRSLLDVTKDISTGDFDSDINKDLGIFNDFKNDIVEIRANFKHAVEEEVHSQKMKTELISNVSHDLKTPLTSIITYTDLLKSEDLTEKERKKYVNTLDRNAIRLKHLIEDLFEVSKANSGNIKLEKMEIDICSLMMQVQVELADKFVKAKLDMRNTFSSDKIVCFMDPQKTYRIFENLLTNIAKYALPSTRVYINIIEKDKQVEISLRNISATELDFNAEYITERFMRGDKSRNTEGSGLGLAIAKTFSELHGGKLDIVIDGDLFKVILQFPKNIANTAK